MNDPRTPVSVTVVHRRGRVYTVRIFDQDAYNADLAATPTTIAPAPTSPPDRPLRRNAGYAGGYQQKKRKQGFQWVQPLPVTDQLRAGFSQRNIEKT